MRFSLSFADRFLDFLPKTNEQRSIDVRLG